MSLKESAIRGSAHNLLVANEYVGRSFSSEGQPGRFIRPSNEKYPYLWLWDAYKHIIILAVLNDIERSKREFSNSTAQQESDGSLAHVKFPSGVNWRDAAWAFIQSR